MKNYRFSMEQQIQHSFWFGKSALRCQFKYQFNQGTHTAGLLGKPTAIQGLKTSLKKGF